MIKVNCISELKTEIYNQYTNLISTKNPMNLKLLFSANYGYEGEFLNFSIGYMSKEIDCADGYISDSIGKITSNQINSEKFKYHVCEYNFLKSCDCTLPTNKEAIDSIIKQKVENTINFILNYYKMEEN